MFGTLLHRALLDAVTGRAVADGDVMPASLPGHRVAWAAGQVFPMLAANAGRSADGLLLNGLDAGDLARLDYYEAAFGYVLHPVTVTDGQGKDIAARVYLTPPGLWTAGADWSLTDWQNAHGAVNVDAAFHAMALFGTLDADAMGARYPAIRAMAVQRLSAPQVSVLRHDVPYQGFQSLADYTLRHRRFDGSLSDDLDRLVVVGATASIVLPYDPVRDRVLLIRQFRMGPFARGDADPWPFEPVAGRVDAGETPDDAARREAVEEAGLHMRDLHRIAAGYPSPGSTSEYFHVFLGICDLPDDIADPASSGGKVDEHEDIQAVLMSYTQFDRALMAGAFNVIPLVMAGHWLARNRERLHRAALRASA